MPYEFAARRIWNKNEAPLSTAEPLLGALGLLAAAAGLLAFPRETAEAVKDSILYCLTVLTPSLFPFMVLTGFGADSSAGLALGKLLGPLFRRVFRLPPVCAAPILMSFIGGYPAGARGASLLLEQGKVTEEQAGRMMLFCVNPGVAFVVTFLGGAVLHSFQAGWRLFAAVTAAGVLLGALSSLGRPLPGPGLPERASPPGSALPRAVTGASKSVLQMCACIVLFAAFSAVLTASGIFGACGGLLARATPLTGPEASAALSFLLEVTRGVGAAADFQVGPAFFAFGLAFGGLCVHLQLFSFFKKFPVKKGKFFLFRFLHGVLSALAYIILIKLLPGSPVEAFAAEAVRQVSPLSGTLAGGLSLLLMCAAFLLVAGPGEAVFPPRRGAEKQAQSKSGKSGAPLFHRSGTAK